MSNKLLTAREIAEELNVNSSIIKRLGRQGKIPRIMITSKTIRYDKDVVLDVLSRGNSPKPQENK